MPNKVFEVAHEQKRTAKSYFGAHCNTSDLVKIFTGKLKGVPGEYQVDKAQKRQCTDGRPDPYVEKELEKIQTFRLRD